MQKLLHVCALNVDQKPISQDIFIALYKLLQNSQLIHEQCLAIVVVFRLLSKYAINQHVNTKNYN